MQPLEFFGRYTLEPTLVAHNLDFVVILYHVDEYQFVPSGSAGTYST